MRQGTASKNYPSVTCIIPTIQLSNGVIVGNFSSNHKFEFEDGRVLPARNKETSERLSVSIEEKYTENPMNPSLTDVEMSFSLSKEIEDELKDLCEENIHDVIIIPNMMMDAIKHNLFNAEDGYIIKNDVGILQNQKGKRGRTTKRFDQWCWNTLRVMKAKSRTDRRLRIDQFCI